MGLYAIGVLGQPSDAQLAKLRLELNNLIQDFEFTVGKELEIYLDDEFLSKDNKAACVAVYFGNVAKTSTPIVEQLISLKVPIIPVLEDNRLCQTHLPACLLPLNCVFLDQDPQMQDLSTSILECLGLLHEQRHIFISYRRIESREAAIQLHDALSSKGFDVFLDTHDIRPGTKFQEALWHKLCDSDVMIMLDTQSYFSSRWTSEEFFKAQAKGILMLRVVWPNHTPNKLSDLAQTISLAQEDIETSGKITDDKVNAILITAERLRSKSIAIRHLKMVSQIKEEATSLGYSYEGIGKHRAVLLRNANSNRVLAYPIVGIPNAMTINSIHQNHLNTQTPISIFVYDDAGFSKKWMNHIEWLHVVVPDVKPVKFRYLNFTLPEYMML